MKKLQIRKSKRKAAETQAANSRITNETVAENRERILAGGRRFKYPHQYVRHKLVINAIIIAIVTVIVVAAVGWWQLYKVQNTSEFMYRVTRVVPVPVASVDGQKVRYSDYLMRYRSQELWLRAQGQLGISGEDGKKQLDFIKRSVLDGLESDMYAQKKATQLHVSVSDADVQTAIDSTRKTATGQISQKVYDASTKDTLGYAPDEYRHIIKQALLRQKVAYAVDTQAQQLKDQVGQTVRSQSKPMLDKIVADYKKKGVKLDFGSSGLVPKNNQDGGLTQAALTLQNGRVSQGIESTTGDGYYFVQRLASNDRQISYQYIRIPLSVFADQVAQLKKSDKIQEFISIP